MKPGSPVPPGSDCGKSSTRVSGACRAQWICAGCFPKMLPHDIAPPDALDAQRRQLLDETQANFAPTPNCKRRRNIRAGEVGERRCTNAGGSVGRGIPDWICVAALAYLNRRRAPIPRHFACNRVMNWKRCTRSAWTAIRRCIIHERARRWMVTAARIRLTFAWNSTRGSNATHHFFQASNCHSFFCLTASCSW